jgi:hypothetical protein
MKYFYNDKFEAIVDINSSDILLYNCKEFCETTESDYAELMYKEILGESTLDAFNTKVLTKVLIDALEIHNNKELVVCVIPFDDVDKMDTVRVAPMNTFIKDWYYLTDKRYKFYSVMDFINHLKNL